MYGGDHKILAVLKRSPYLEEPQSFPLAAFDMSGPDFILLSLGSLYDASVVVPPLEIVASSQSDS